MIGNHFIAAVRPHNAYFNVPVGGKSMSLYLKARGRGFCVTTTRAMEFADETELWSHLAGEYPWLMAALSVGTVFQRALAQRAELLLNSPATLDGMTAALHEQVYALNRTILEHLDATVTTKKTPALLKPSLAASMPWHELRQNTRLPYMTGTIRVVCRAFPSPFDDSAWALDVLMPPGTPEETMETQRRIQSTTDDLMGRGIRVGDVLNGTGLCVR